MEALKELVKEIDRIYGKKKINRRDLERLLKKCRKVRKTLSRF
ncbi:MAG: hypothetical protein ACOX0R_00370 [Candidatus Dojkabacteria bacterium]